MPQPPQGPIRREGPTRRPTRGPGPLKRAWDGSASWHGTILVVLIALALLVTSFIGAARPYEAELVAVLFPVVAVAMGSWPLHGARARLMVAGLVLALVTIGITVAQVASAIFPPEPLGQMRLSTAHPAGDVEVASDQGPLALVVRGHLGGSQGSAVGRFHLLAQRGAAQRVISGKLERVVHGGSRGFRGAAAGRSVERHETLREPLVLAGRGPLRLRLQSLDEDVLPELELSVRPGPWPESTMYLVFACIVFAGALVEAAADRTRVKAATTSGAATAALFAYHIVHHWNPDDPMSTVIGGVLFAVIAGMLGGLLVGRVAAFAGRRLIPAPDA